MTISPADQFEAARPSAGVAIRVRCAWENTPQGLAKTPLAELINLTLDGETVAPQLVARRRPNGLFDDHYHLLALSNPPAGKHTVTATVRQRTSGLDSQRTIEFVV